MKTIISLAISIFIVVVLQTSVINFFDISDIRPNLVLLFVVFTGLIFGAKYGLIVGFFCGVLVDVLNGDFFGLNILSFAIVGLFSGRLQKNVFEDSYLFSLFVVVLASFLIMLFWNICVFFVEYDYINYSSMFFITFGTVVYNSFLTFPCIYIANKIRKVAR